MKDIIQKLLAAFDVEHREHLVKIRAFIASLEPGADPQGARVEIGEAFRCAHSLKGASRVVDLKSVSELAHGLEALFVAIQSHGKKTDPEMLSIIARVLDCIEDTVVASRSGQPLPDIKELKSSLENLLSADRVITSVPEAPKTTLNPESLRASVPIETTAVSVPVSLTSLAADIPSPDSRQELGVLAKTASARAGASYDTMRLSAEHFDRLIKSAGEVISFSRNQQDNVSKLKESTQLLQGIEKEWLFVQKQSAAYLRQISTDADKNRLVKYLNFVESQVRTIGRQLRSVSGDQKNGNFTLKHLGEQLQDDVQTARLIPAFEVFESFSKMMRDLARDEGKELDFKMNGLDIEADRIVLQALKDPLMHMLRNSLSHGIETADQRMAKGKPRAGKITLTMESVGRRLVISIFDDGQGIAHENIRRRAYETALLPKAELDVMDGTALLNLIFHPGFSTAASLTEISGRGVGMSVVKDSVDRLQGDIQIDNRIGISCSFKISVPLSQSTHRLLLMGCQGQILAVPTHSVQNVMRAKSHDLQMVEGRSHLKVKDQIVPIMALSQLIGMKDGSVLPTEDTIAFAILKSGERRLAVAVDRLIGEREGLIKDLGAPLSSSNRFSGGVILDRSSMVLVLNPNALFEAFQQLRQGQPLQITQRQKVAQRLRILVVDDSFTTRILEKSILEAKGYHVDIATDGLEALAFLRSHEVDLIISDVEMPHMDGLTLLQNVRSNPLLSKIPMIMVSSKNLREDQEKGLRLGAQAYLPKQDFNQKVLLDTIRQVL